MLNANFRILTVIAPHSGGRGRVPLRNQTPKLFQTSERGERGGAAAAPARAQASAGSASRAEHVQFQTRLWRHTLSRFFDAMR